jgi:roadblock/LC7 domain-containing protein
MKKFLLGFLGLATVAGTADAAILRGSAPGGLAQMVRASTTVQARADETPSTTTPAAETPTTPAAPVQVVNPNTGNVMTESKLPDGTTLYTDPISGEKFVMSADGKLVAYVDEDDKVIPQLNATVKQARNACLAIETEGYQAEFNELTYDCMVPVVAKNWSGVISSSDGDAVGYYPFGSFLKCDADLFDSISVMRRSSQYVVPLMIVGGAGIGAGIGAAVRDEDAEKRKAEVTYKILDESETVTETKERVSDNSSAVESEKTAAKADAERLLTELKNEHYKYFCQAYPMYMVMRIRDNVMTELPQKGNAFEKTFVDKNDNDMENYAISFNSFMQLDLGEEGYKDVGDQCKGARDLQAMLKNSGATFEYKPNPNGYVKFAVNDVATFKTELNKYATVSAYGLSTNNIGTTAQMLSQTMSNYSAAMLKTTNEIGKLLNERGTMLSHEILDQLNIMVNKTKVIEKVTPETSIFDNSIVKGAAIGAGVGAAAGLAYFFAEGANIDCLIGNIKTIGLDDTYRLPSFREYLQSKGVQQ